MLYSRTLVPCLTLPQQVQAVTSSRFEKSHLLSPGTEHSHKNRSNQVRGWSGEKLPQTPKLPPPFQSHADKRGRK